MPKPFVVRWTPPLPEREQREFGSLSEALDFAASVATPLGSSVDIRTPAGLTLSVIATDNSKIRREK